MWLRNVCSTRVMATWSSMVMVTLWLTIARGGSVFSLGMSRPWVWTRLPQARQRAKTGRKRRMGKPFRRYVTRDMFLSCIDETSMGTDW